jgi:hypothetical protein
MQSEAHGQLRFELGGGPGSPGHARVEESTCRLLAFHVVALRARVRDELHVPDGRGDYGANQSGGGHAIRRTQTHSEVIRAHQSSSELGWQMRCAYERDDGISLIAIAISRNQRRCAYERDDGRSEPPSVAISRNQSQSVAIRRVRA